MALPELLLELIEDPLRPMMLIDERRFGRDYGFDDERVVLAGVLLSAETLLAFGLFVQSVRDEHLDEQKRLRAIKSADVLGGRLASILRPAVEAALLRSAVTFWATTQGYLEAEKRRRDGPAAYDVNGGVVNGRETPVIEMMSGDAAEQIKKTGGSRLDVVVDRSAQNGLAQGHTHDTFMLYEVEGAARATQNGVPIRLGEGVQRRFFAVSERTPTVGDWVLLADVAAHLWGNEPKAIEYLRHDHFLNGVQKVAVMPGTAVIGELRKIPVE